MTASRGRDTHIHLLWTLGLRLSIWERDKVDGMAGRRLSFIHTMISRSLDRFYYLTIHYFPAYQSIHSFAPFCAVELVPCRLPYPIYIATVPQNSPIMCISPTIVFSLTSYMYIKLRTQAWGFEVDWWLKGSEVSRPSRHENEWRRVAKMNSLFFCSHTTRTLCYFVFGLDLIWQCNMPSNHPARNSDWFTGKNSSRMCGNRWIENLKA